MVNKTDIFEVWSIVYQNLCNTIYIIINLTKISTLKYINVHMIMFKISISFLKYSQIFLESPLNNNRVFKMTKQSKLLNYKCTKWRYLAVIQLLFYIKC